MVFAPLLPKPCVCSLIVMSGSFGNSWKGKQQERRGLDLWGMIGREGSGGIGFYGWLMGESSAIGEESNLLGGLGE